MLIESVAAYLFLNKKKMPLTDDLERLKQYISLNVEDDTIRIVSSPSGIRGACLWKLTTAESGEPGTWDHSDPDGDIIVICQLVADSKDAVGRMAGYLLDRYPQLKEVWGERSGKNKRYSIEFLKRLRNG